MNRNEVRKKMKDAIKTRFGVHGKVIRCPSIEVMAKYIATYLRLECRISDWTSSTDRSISGSRLRRPGLGREGKRLEVVDENSTTIFDHRTGDTYRHNTDVARWIFKREENLEHFKPKGKIKAVRTWKNGEYIEL